MLAPFGKRRGPAAPPARRARAADRERLERVLQDLVACRQLLDPR